MLELLYACGLRISELINLDVLNFNARQGIVKVVGKGNKERLVPMGEQALKWGSDYIADGRDKLISEKKNHKIRCISKALYFNTSFVVTHSKVPLIAILL